MRRDPRVREAGLTGRSEPDAGVDGHGTYLTAPPGSNVLLEYPERPGHIFYARLQLNVPCNEC